MDTPSGDECYVRQPNGVLARTVGRTGHRAEDYDEQHLDLLASMQEEHFWYRGRHRFVLHAFHQVRRHDRPMSAIDLGGGCGGWVKYLSEREPSTFGELALGDSSPVALEHAEGIIGALPRYLIDLYDLGWSERWDAVFLLDVLEHLDEDGEALRQVAASLTPGGTAMITTPAFPRFWSWTDDLAHHKRRYVKRDFAPLAQAAGLEVVRLRYFHFLLSPLLVASRLNNPRLEKRTAEEVDAIVRRSYQVPSRLVNATLGAVFAAETPIGWNVPFPWGTSILAVLRKP